MTKRLFLIITAIIIAFSFSSCIDLIEEVTVNNDLSGHYEMRLETGGLSGLMDLGGQQDIPQIRELNEKISLLRSQPGISNVDKSFRSGQLQFNISFDFEDEASLNNAIYQLAGIESSMFVKKFLKIKKNKVVRPNLNPYLKKFIDDQELLEQLPSTDLLQYVNYKFIVKTPKKVKSLSGDKAMLQSNKQTVISSYSFKELILDKKNVYLKIRM